MTTVLNPPLQDDLYLLPIMSVSPQGTPVLPGIKLEAITLVAPLPDKLLSGFAVCKAFGDAKIAVLGYMSHDAVEAANATEANPDQVTIRNGKSAIHLHADGRVRIEGEDVKVVSHGRLGLAGAYIELN